MQKIHIILVVAGITLGSLLAIKPWKKDSQKYFNLITPIAVIEEKDSMVTCSKGMNIASMLAKKPDILPLKKTMPRLPHD